MTSMTLPNQTSRCAERDRPEAEAIEFDVVVVGLGYVGLPLALEACSAKWRVAGLDSRADRIAALRSRRSYVEDVPDDSLEAMFAAGFVATDNPGVLARARAVVICVPTPVTQDRQPDLSNIITAAETVARYLRPEMLVVLESTTYPGTTEEIVRPILESRGLRAGVDFYLAFAPERIDPGNRDYSIRTTPRVVGGSTDACAAVAIAFYKGLTDKVIQARGTREAELSKLIENMYRQVNIALVNELAILCHDLDVDLWDALRCASSKPFGFHAFWPGPGVGGHCVPVDPHYLIHKARSADCTVRLSELADEINRRMPQYVVERITEMLNRHMLPLNGSKILLLGVSYKQNIGDLRGSPAAPIATRLATAGARVSYHDPYVPEWNINGTTFFSVSDPKMAIEESSLVVLLQKHSEYSADLLAGCHHLLDTCGAMGGQAEETL